VGSRFARLDEGLPVAFAGPPHWAAASSMACAAHGRWSDHAFTVDELIAWDWPAAGSVAGGA
jgi:hypothetical protein